MRRYICMMLSCTALLALGAAPGEAANLLVNPDFATGFTSWEDLQGSFFTNVHDAGFGFVAPGSLHILAADAPQGFVALRQCLPVTGGAAYDFGGWFQATAGLPQVLRGFMVVTWFSAPGCSTAVGTASTNVSSATPGVWEGLQTQNAVAPASAQSASVGLAFLQPTAVAQGHFDDVYFGPDPTTPVELSNFTIE